jgi:hypothetical protein
VAFVFTKCSLYHHRLFTFKTKIPIPYWYDILLLFSAALNGLLLGLVHFLQLKNFLLIVMEIEFQASSFCVLFFFVHLEFIWAGTCAGTAGILSLTPVSSCRYFRQVFNPFDHFGTWAVTVLFGSFFYVMYYSIKKFIHHKPNQF